MNIQTRPDPVARGRELATEIAAATAEIERTRRIPQALLERLHDSRRLDFISPLNDRLSQTNTEAPATMPAGKVLS